MKNNPRKKQITITINEIEQMVLIDLLEMKEGEQLQVILSSLNEPEPLLEQQLEDVRNLMAKIKADQKGKRNG